MKVFVTGATGVMGRSAARALRLSGHSVVGLARNDAKAALLADEGVEPVRARLFDIDSLAEAFAGCSVVCNMATCVPVGSQAMRARAWRAHDRIHIDGSRTVVAAARRAGVQRIVQESASVVYADAGEEWIDERSPVTVNRAVEPTVLAEAHAEEFGGAARDWIVLRFGAIVGDDAFTTWRLARARAGHAVGFGDPRGWTHVVHPADVGSAVLAALSAPSGTYNVGAQPVRRRELVDAFAQAVGRSKGRYAARVMQRLGGERLELLTRSQRVSSDALTQAAAWKPAYGQFDVSWLTEPAHESVEAR